MRGAAPKSPITGVPGWISADEQDALLKLARGVPAGGQIVEIGAEFGCSASLFATGAAPGIKITSVDLFPGDLMDVYAANLAEVGLGRTTAIRAASQAVFAQWEMPIDLLYIDGDHNYNGVKADIDGWTRFVKVGGVVAFHDVAQDPGNPAANAHYLHLDVAKAVSEFRTAEADSWIEVGRVRSLLVLRRVVAWDKDAVPASQSEEIAVPIPDRYVVSDSPIGENPVSPELEAVLDKAMPLPTPEGIGKVETLDPDDLELEPDPELRARRKSRKS